MVENKVKVWCEFCGGKGYYSVPNYDWNENPIAEIELDCSECDGDGYTLLEHSGGVISDGYHTFDELYFHRMVLFSVVCNQNYNVAWKSKLHDDGTMYENYFIVGITTEEGDYTYHFHMDNWGYFDINEIDKAPKWDGHKPKDITRLLNI